MNSLFQVTIKGIISLVFLFFTIKFLGKKQISELNIFDYVIGISLGNIAAEMTVSEDISISMGLLAMTIYGAISLFVSYITLKNIHFRRFISGYPIVLIENGKISKEQLGKVKIDINDLLQDARENGYFDISEIEYAVMEVSGKVSFLPKSKYKPVTLNDLKIKSTYAGLSANLVMDGKIMYNNLKSINKDVDWLIKRLSKEGYDNIEDLFLVICDSKEKLTIYTKDIRCNLEVLE